MKIVVLGFGPFGQALTKLLLKKNRESSITCIDLERDVVEDAIQQSFSLFRDQLTAAGHADEICPQVYAEADVVFCAVGSRYMTQTMKTIVPYMTSGSGIVNVAKALSSDGYFFHEEFLLHKRPDISYAVISGGMAAQDITHDQVTGATIASADASFCGRLEDMFSSEFLETETTSDVLGVEMAGVLKNLLSIKAGYLGSTKEIDTFVVDCTDQIWNLCDHLTMSKTTFDGTYCRNHEMYGDIKISCYGGTRNFLLGETRRSSVSLVQAIKVLHDQGITIEGAHTLNSIASFPEHILRSIPFVQALVDVYERG